MSTAAAFPDLQTRWRWVRSARYDQMLIVGTTGLALIAGAVAFVQPTLLPMVIGMDAMLLARQHVVAAYTRIAMDDQSFRQYRSLVVWLPFPIVGTVLALYAVSGTLVIQTLYFYLQWFHYVRQSYGVERIYARASGGGGRPDRLTTSVIYLVPIWGLLARSARGAREGAKFLGLPILWLPVPQVVLGVACAAALIALGLWLRRLVMQARSNTLQPARSLYLASHVLIFCVAYLGLKSVDHGWLVVNVWHNTQYILIVWLYNVNRFRKGVQPERRLLSSLSQRRAVLAYVLVCLGLATFMYTVVDGAAGWLTRFGLPAGMMLYAAINFHHYAVDAVIWKLRRPEVRTTLVAA